MYISKRYPKHMEIIYPMDWESLGIPRSHEERDEQVYKMCMRLNILDLSPKQLQAVTGVSTTIIKNCRFGYGRISDGDLVLLQSGMNKIELIVSEIKRLLGEYNPNSFPNLRELKEYRCGREFGRY